jgi:hypothetical protein
MNFYSFGLLEDAETLYNHHYSGMLLTYTIDQGNYFIRVAESMDKGKNFKYMVAVRPYLVSPQFLCTINNSINLIDKDRIQINFVSGFVKDNEKDFGGVLGLVNDSSSNIEKSNYLIEYIKNIENIKNHNLDYYVTATNKFVFNEMSSIGSKMIISHDQYKDKVYDLSNKKIMVAIIPILRETQEEIDSISPNKIMSDYEYMTYDNFKIFIKELENNGINEIMICCWDRKEKRRIHNLVKEYKEENGFIL